MNIEKVQNAERPSILSAEQRLSEEVAQALRSFDGAATVNELTQRIFGPPRDEGKFRQHQNWVSGELRAAYWRGEVEREDGAGQSLPWRYWLPDRADTPNPDDTTR